MSTCRTQAQRAWRNTRRRPAASCRPSAAAPTPAPPRRAAHARARAGGDRARRAVHSPAMLRPAAPAAAAAAPSAAAAAPAPPLAALQQEAPPAPEGLLFAPGQEQRRYFSHEALMDEYARRQPTPLTVRSLVELGDSVRADPGLLVESARFLHDEMLVRLARRAKELGSLPYGLSESRHVATVRSWYEESWAQFVSTGVPENGEQEAGEFCQMLEGVLTRHLGVVPLIARAVIDLRGELGDSAVDECPYLHDFLDRFYMSRIGVRLLLANHLELHHQREGFSGTLGVRLNPTGVIQDAASDATQKCEEAYGVAPEVEVHGMPGDLAAPIVPSHLHHIMHELLKNSMRAVVERHGADLGTDLPPIRVTVAGGRDDVCVRVSDEGGGIPQAELSQAWNYLYTTHTRPDELTDADAGPQGLRGAPLAGLGYGLPISRLFARYFGGDLDLVSIDGHGTDAYVYINRASTPGHEIVLQ